MARSNVWNSASVRVMPAAATSKPLPEAFGKLVQPEKTFLMAPEDVAKNRKAWIDEWLKAMSL